MWNGPTAWRVGTFMDMTAYARTGRISGVSSTRLLNPKPSDRAGRTVVEVYQRVLDKDGNTLLEGTVQHVYQVRDGLIRHMEIRNPTEDATSPDQK